MNLWRWKSEGEDLEKQLEQCLVDLRSANDNMTKRALQLALQARALELTTEEDDQCPTDS